MASQTRSLKLSPDLMEIVETRAFQLGYASVNAYFKGLVRYDAMCQTPHIVTLPIAQMRPEAQDDTDSTLLGNVKSGVIVKHAFLVGLAKDLAKGKYGSPEEFGEAIAKVLAKSKKSA